MANRDDRGHFVMKDLTGQTYGNLTAQWPAGRIGDRIATVVMWLCSCACGRLSVVRSGKLLYGGTISCGCLASKPPIQFEHGHCRKDKQSPEHQSWAGMLQRCNNPQTANYADYGGRGITVCERWLEFPNFLTDMGLRPERRTLDRINNNGNYEPGNCKWSTKSEQNRNKRKRHEVLRDRAIFSSKIVQL